jgi:hypothetical protein
MKKLTFLAILSFISLANHAQTLNLSKAKEVKIIQGNYSIMIPKELHVKETRADFYGYSIVPKNKGLIHKFQVWIYYGHFPSTVETKSSYELIDKTNIQVLHNNISFKIYKTALNYYTEGFIIEEPSVSPNEGALQFRISGQSDNPEDFKKVIETIKTLNLSENLILND